MNDWSESCKTVLDGFEKHKTVLDAVMTELNEGCNKLLDGFICTAIHAHQWETESLMESVREKDTNGVLHVLTSVLGGIARFYNEADFSASKTWEEYQPEYEEWIEAMRHCVALGHQKRL